MLVKTKNSTYRVTAQGDKFLVQKVSAENPESTYMNVGESVVTGSLGIQLGGGPMRFAGVRTSTVVSVTEE